MLKLKVITVMGILLGALSTVFLITNILLSRKLSRSFTKGIISLLLITISMILALISADGGFRAQQVYSTINNSDGLLPESLNSLNYMLVRDMDISTSSIIGGYISLILYRVLYVSIKREARREMYSTKHLLNRNSIY